MLSNARRVPRDTAVAADICVIGAGAAGITIARELAGSGLRVVVLESGGEQFDTRTQTLYRGRSTGLPYFPLDGTRLRYLGGSTNHWGGVCRPFDQVDFERREWIPYSGWPISRTDLDPYYPEASTLVGLSSDDFSSASWESRDDHPPLELGPQAESRVSQIVDHEDRSFAVRYGSDLEAAGDVDVYLYANVTEIETDPGGGSISRVHVATLSGNRFTVEARAFVLAAGGIENPRLLLASNRQQPRGLGNQHDLVGRFFAEHPRFVAAVVAPSDADLGVGFYEIHHVDDTDIQGYVVFPESVRQDEGLVDVQVFVEPVYDPRFEAAFDSDDVESLRALARSGETADDFRTNLMNVVGDLTTFRDYTIPGAPLPVPYPEVVERALDDPDELRDDLPALLGDIAAEGYRRLNGSAPLDSLELVTRLDQAPNPDSRITLAPGARDALGMPRVNLDWRLTELDRYSAARSVEILAGAFAAAGLGRVQIIFDEAGSGWPEDLEGGNHHIGTTRMSDDEKRGVVDRDCRVHGISNLFVAGSSVFPTSGSATPTLTIVALALRLVDHLRGELS